MTLWASLAQLLSSFTPSFLCKSGVSTKTVFLNSFPAAWGSSLAFNNSMGGVGNGLEIDEALETCRTKVPCAARRIAFVPLLEAQIPPLLLITPLFSPPLSAVLSEVCSE